MTDKARELSRYGEDADGQIMSCNDGEFVYYSSAMEVIQSQSARIAELEAQRDELLAHIDHLGEITDTCTRYITKKVCSYCQCIHKAKAEVTK